MIPSLLVALLAGVLTALAPCVVLVAPLVVGAGAVGGRRRSAGILAGFAATFLLVAFILAATLASAGFSAATLRVASAALLLVVGLGIAVPGARTAVAARLAPLVRAGDRLARARPGDGLAGGLVLGAAIGLVWAPCVGPLMAGALATAATTGPTVETLLVASAYVLGAAVPLGILAEGGRRVAGGPGAPGRQRARRALGVMMAGSALLVATGADLDVQAGIAGVLPPGWSDALARFEDRGLAQGDAGRADSQGDGAATSGGSSAPGPLDAGLPGPVASALPDHAALDDLGPAPDFTGIQAWINSTPLTIDALRGKVVLVEFWTFACINCIHVQPYVTAWEERYASSGLVVVGVHSPELSFERELANVRDAVKKAGIRYPVAVDPDFATWNAFRNRYWPALYFIDRSGRIRHTHAGEGDYEGSERVLRELLAAPG